MEQFLFLVDKIVEFVILRYRNNVCRDNAETRANTVGVSS